MKNGFYTSLMRWKVTLFLSGLVFFVSGFHSLPDSRDKKINQADSVITPDSIFQIGEELTYNVSYAFIDIGQVRVRQLEETGKDNQKVYKAVAYIDSYRGVPLVNLHAVFESLIHQSVHSTWFSARDKKDEQWMSYIYNFDYLHRQLRVEESIWKSNNVTKRDTLTLDTLYQDGLSLFFFARKLALTKQQINVPVFVNEKKFTTVINFTGEQRDEKIDAVDYPVDLTYFNGESGFVGIFGLTGGFEGWFSNDAARVPVIAKMKVLIGNIRIELMSWKRNGWIPPKYIKAK